MDFAQSLMLQYNVRLVYAQAKTYLGKEVAFADLVTAGMLGMLRAIQKFDPSKGFKFSTYAHLWIKQSLQRCVAHQSRVSQLLFAHSLMHAYSPTRSLAHSPTHPLTHSLSSC